MSKAGWKKVRTCSRVSSGPCSQCKGQTYFQAYRKDRIVLCRDCYEEKYDPEAKAEREAGIARAEAERKRDLELALEGKLPGAKITENGTVFGPPTQICGVTSRQVLREGTFDTESFASNDKLPPKDPPPSIFANFKAFKPKRQG